MSWSRPFLLTKGVANMVKHESSKGESVICNLGVVEIDHDGKVSNLKELKVSEETLANYPGFIQLPDVEDKRTEGKPAPLSKTAQKAADKKAAEEAASIKAAEGQDTPPSA